MIPPLPEPSRPQLPYTAGMICPKCHYERQDHDHAVMAGVCPACGIAYEKYRRAETERRERMARFEAARQRSGIEEPGRMFPQDPGLNSGLPESGTGAADPDPLLDPEVRAGLGIDDTPDLPRWRRLYDYLTYVPPGRHESTFLARALLYAGITLWGFDFILGGIDWVNIGSSFLHNANLAFHEFGHVLAAPLGTWWMFLGGSLFQILLPLVPLCAFLVQQRDTFAASIMLWWCGQNFIDVSPYIQDAPLRAIPLITGNDDSHDWWNLLSMSGALDRAGTYANFCFGMGAALILLSNAWGAHLLWREYRQGPRPARRALRD